MRHISASNRNNVVWGMSVMCTGSRVAGCASDQKTKITEENVAIDNYIIYSTSGDAVLCAIRERSSAGHILILASIDAGNFVLKSVVQK
jgi:hypothetical protein